MRGRLIIMIRFAGTINTLMNWGQFRQQHVNRPIGDRPFFPGFSCLNVIRWGAAGADPDSRCKWEGMAHIDLRLMSLVVVLLV